MKYSFAIICLCAVVALVSSHPLDSNIQRVTRQSQDEASSTIPLNREKRTIGFLRDLFPNFSRIIDNKIQQLTRIIFRIVGRLVLNGGGGGGGGGGGEDERRISITLPTYPPDELEDEDEDEDSTDSASEATSNDDATATTTTSSPNADDNAVASSNINEVRVKREAAQENPIAPESDANGANASEEADTGEEEDLDSEATGDNEVTGDDNAESSEAEEEEPEGDDRNKRFLNFNVAATDSANGGGGSAGGSGNFLFDIIRLVAGSGSGSSGSGDSSGTEEGKNNDEAAYGVGVPGPLTRLFVVANRGVASLIQDLILRLAQTSERIVNFKARLITSII